jgi:hypothetical protein
MSTSKGGTQAQNAALKAYEDKIRAQIREGKAKLEEVAAMASEKKAQAEIDLIGGLNAARQNIERKLGDLKKTSDAHVSRAKADIDADVANFKSSIDQVASKFKTRSTAR